jgi:secreted PhoX family phosphatase
MHRSTVLILLATAAGAVTACQDVPGAAAPSVAGLVASASADNEGAVHFAGFSPLTASAACTVSGGDPTNPLLLPAGFSQTIIASEPDFITNGDMQAWNETGPQVGRFLYRPHETGPNSGISITDLTTGVTRMLLRRQDWSSLDGIIWTPWGTLLFAEEQGNTATNPDPDFPLATAGLVYELDPVTLQVAARPGLGSKSHEGQIIDRDGNYYGISEKAGGALFKFVPDLPGDYSAGQLYAFTLTTDLGDRTGPGTWVPLDRAASQINADVEAAAKLATGYGRPEDLERWVSPNGTREVLYAAITSENRVLALDISDPANPVASTVVKQGVNAPADFIFPDNLAFDRFGNLFVAEDPGGSFPGKVQGDDIWMATLGSDPAGLAASFTRFASLNDCDAEPTGLLFDKSGKRLFVNIQHRGGDGLDKTVAISRTPGNQ